MKKCHTGGLFVETSGDALRSRSKGYWGWAKPHDGVVFFFLTNDGVVEVDDDRSGGDSSVPSISIYFVLSQI
jgi:hypothetical protein